MGPPAPPRLYRHGFVFLDRGLMIGVITMAAFGGCYLLNHGALHAVKELEAFMG